MKVLTAGGLYLAISVCFLLHSPAYAQNVSTLPEGNVISISLADALVLADNNNIDIKISLDDRLSATADAAAVSAALAPSLSATSYGTFGDSTNIVTSPTLVQPQSIINISSSRFADQNVTLMVPIFTGGRLENQSLAARLVAKSLDFSGAAAVLNVKEEVTEKYADALLDDQLIAVAKSRVDAEAEQVRLTQEDVDQGHAAPVDLLREQAELADAGQELVTATNQKQLNLVILKQLLGMAQDNILTLSDTLDSVGVGEKLPASLAEALSMADQHSPNIRASNLQISSTGAATSALKGSFLPQVYAVAMSDASSMSDGKRVGYTIGLAASLSLYDAGERADAVDASRARQSEAADQATKTRQQVDADTASAWLNLQTAVAQAAGAAAGVLSAQKSFTLADMRYNAGKSISTERLDALTALTRAQESLADAQLGQIVARARLIEVTGG